MNGINDRLTSKLTNRIAAVIYEMSTLQQMNGVSLAVSYITIW